MKSLPVNYSKHHIFPCVLPLLPDCNYNYSTRCGIIKRDNADAWDIEDPIISKLVQVMWDKAYKMKDSSIFTFALYSLRRPSSLRNAVFTASWRTVNPASTSDNWPCSFCRKSNIDYYIFRYIDEVCYKTTSLTVCCDFLWSNNRSKGNLVDYFGACHWLMYTALFHFGVAHSDVATVGWWIPLTKASNAELFNKAVGDSRRHNAYVTLP